MPNTYRFGLERTLDISVSGMMAQRLEMELVASNLANINTTRSIQGGPYCRRLAIFEEKPLDFAQTLMRAEQKITGGGGVDIADVAEDHAPYQRVYKPGHPDADPYGFVMMPNVDMAKEMTNLVYSSRLYDANITAFNAAKKMAQETMQLP
ncbi:MAG: flagellar basal body rod protein FlgC [Candidatus Saganbacteria bacterium]|nr:flagellar basal body rod protein FlgC [Candidatus Saganbacteria bacterium]